MAGRTAAAASPPDEQRTTSMPRRAARPAKGSEQPVNGNERRTRETRAALLRAARELLRTRGYAAVTVAHITRRARRAHGTFYLHFENKEAIYAALLDEMWLDLRDQGREMWHPEAPMESLRSTVHRFLTAYRENIDLWELAEDMAASNPHFRKLRIQHRRFLVRRIRRGIEGSLAFGNIEGLNVDIVAEMLGGVLQEISRVNFREYEDWPVDLLVDNIVQVWGRVLGYVAVPRVTATPPHPLGQAEIAYPPLTG